MLRKGDQQIINAFGRKLRKFRKEKKWSIRDLALEADIDHALVGKYELGQTAPTLPTIYRLAAALGVSPADLLPDK